MGIKKYEFTGEKKFDIRDFDTSDTGELSKEELHSLVSDNMALMREYQDKLYAEGKNGILIIFQAMDAAGKDGAVNHVFSGLNPQGVDVLSFKQPTSEELAHDYLWRIHKHVPQRGKIAIFNRSYYEDVLVAKVHKLYEVQNLPDRCKEEDVIHKRYGHIRDFEEYLWDNGITVVKFFLHISKDEQKKQFLERIDDKSKNWKFSKSDLSEREYWEDYQKAYEKAINKTATKQCPWYVIPSDNRWFARSLVSEVIVKVMKEIDPNYPKISKEAEADLQKCRQLLEKEE
ncbi:polyphosphate kinase 2 family protein [Anaerocolumna sp. AGMB13025]|uniref:polyphosphate kinase 2 family protein n=1 Tax=Anaerocolumna sp. AGMB13025 TaxID=3039116 RepID=UPI00241DE365|nr:polyphosphate kinase 2 family protein [Anaerocolumna sp. AGMB13025]WFR55663.1 polyphosphate kinase 2 family protein [Anaerocolumna sp. AGMB13025]